MTIALLTSFTRHIWEQRFGLSRCQQKQHVTSQLVHEARRFCAALLPLPLSGLLDRGRPLAAYEFRVPIRCKLAAYIRAAFFTSHSRPSLAFQGHSRCALSGRIRVLEAVPAPSPQASRRPGAARSTSRAPSASSASSASAASPAPSARAPRPPPATQAEPPCPTPDPPCQARSPLSFVD